MILRCLLLTLSLVPGLVLADYSSIVEARGESCDDSLSSAQNRQLALTDARRNAAEAAQTSVKSFSKVDNYLLVEDLIESYSEANVETLTILSEQSNGSCIAISIRAEVTPQKNLDQKFITEELLADPTIPLTVKLWSGKPTYGISESMAIYIKSNKPFYGRLLYTMNDGTTLQLLPNPYRSDNYFLGQVLYTVPSGEDVFRLTVTPPVGTEKLTLYASTAPLGDIDKTATSGLYLVNNEPKVLSNKTRGLKIESISSSTVPSAESIPPKRPEVAEFAEVSIEVQITD